MESKFVMTSEESRSCIHKGQFLKRGDAVLKDGGKKSVADVLTAHMQKLQNGVTDFRISATLRIIGDSWVVYFERNGMKSRVSCKTEDAVEGNEIEFHVSAWQLARKKERRSKRKRMSVARNNFYQDSDSSPHPSSSHCVMLQESPLTEVKTEMVEMPTMTSSNMQRETSDEDSDDIFSQFSPKRIALDQSLMPSSDNSALFTADDIPKLEKKMKRAVDNSMKLLRAICRQGQDINKEQVIDAFNVAIEKFEDCFADKTLSLLRQRN